MTECRPPEGTPDGTVCWLVHPKDGIHPATWRFHGSWAPHWAWPIVPIGRDPRWVYAFGYRFHSIATPPEDAK